MKSFYAWMSLALFLLGDTILGARVIQPRSYDDDPNDTAYDYAFASDFLFSTATAAYQVEGAWNVSGKGENIWDRLTHEHPELILDGSSGDVACDSYHKFKEDIQMAKSLGTQMYRFSISWSRLLPTGAIDEVNQDGVRYYNDLLDECKLQGIEPMVTIFHWDLPQPLQDIGGFPNPVLVDYFVDYANFVFKTFGSKVKYWIIFNEPYSFCTGGYGGTSKAPAIPSDGRGDYLCAHTILLAHGKVYRLYQHQYKSTQQGKLGMSTFTCYYWPQDPNNEEDVAAAERWTQFNMGWFTHPIYSQEGDYPAVLREYVDAASSRQGLNVSRLPTFTPDEIEMLRGSADFYGFNHYGSLQVAKRRDTDPTQPKTGTREWDADIITDVDPAWETSVAPWLYVVPEGIRKFLQWIKTEYDNPDVFITENGYPDQGELKDVKRVRYYRIYLLQILKAIHEDKCNIIGYTAWSLMDNYEWSYGYVHKYGLYHVDFTDQNRTRTPKMSAKFYKQLIATRKVPKDGDIDFPDDQATTTERPASTRVPSTAVNTRLNLTTAFTLSLALFLYAFLEM